MDIESRTLCKTLEAEMIGSSALMEAEELLDHEGPDYFRGFLQGYYHCLKLADKFDAIRSDEELLQHLTYLTQRIILKNCLASQKIFQ